MLLEYLVLLLFNTSPPPPSFSLVLSGVLEIEKNFDPFKAVAFSSTSVASATDY